MSHDINYNPLTLRHSFFSVKETAWHGLGQIVQDYPTSAEAMQYAGLDFEVIKTPLFTESRSMTIGNGGEIIDGCTVPVPNHYATMRTDTAQVLGVVGKDYEVIQNRDAFSFFDSIVGGGEGIRYETAGALGNGECIFITAKLPGYIRVGNGDDVTEKYLFLSTTHNATGSAFAAFTPIRVVCRNTLNAAMRSRTNVVRIRHTAGAKTRLENAHKLMGMTGVLSGELETIFNQWAKVRITDTQLRKLIQLAMVPNKETLHNLQTGKEDDISTLFKNTCEDVFEYAMTNETQHMDTTKGTVFGAYNAVTGYFQNVRSYKSDEAKLKSTLLGGTAQLRAQKAFDLCNDFATGGADFLNLN